MQYTKFENNFINQYSQSFCISYDKVDGKGEDSYVFNFNENAGIIGVFDGCGGIGGRRYSEFGGKTGAYLASRALSEGLNNWFNQWSEDENNTLQYNELSVEIKREIDKSLGRFEEKIVKRSTLKGGMQKEFPTTVAMCIFRYNHQTNLIHTNVLWSGDSRVYWLGSEGLYQLTKDDVDDEDAMTNIKNDGVLNNVVSLSSPYVLREYAVEVLNKGIVLAASDGCFGYIPSPMHFEYLILKNLMKAESLYEWEMALKREIVEYTGDDATLCGVVFNFDCFEDVKKYYMPRFEKLKQKYIDKFDHLNETQKNVLWKKYKDRYESILEEHFE